MGACGHSVFGVVALYRSRPGATIKSVAEDLGVNTETLQNWIRADDAVGVARDARADAVRSAAGCAVDAAQSTDVVLGKPGPEPRSETPGRACRR
ncbi:transposase [Streptomyces sp. NBC_00208]|uniref:transposase n=1 Tax=Streptomyces sp. NBC_00208 TaxID=2975681 RepID=UPI003FA75FA0